MKDILLPTGICPPIKVTLLPEGHVHSQKYMPPPTGIYPLPQRHTPFHKDTPTLKLHTSSLKTCHTQNDTPPQRRKHLLPQGHTPPTRICSISERNTYSFIKCIPLGTRTCLLPEWRASLQKVMHPPTWTHPLPQGNSYYHKTCLLPLGNAPPQCHATQNWICLLTSTHLLQWHTPTLRDTPPPTQTNFT